NPGAGGDFSLTDTFNNGTITLSKPLAAATVELQFSGAGMTTGSITLGANVSGTSSVTLAGRGSGNITETSQTVQIATPSLTISTGTAAGGGGIGAGLPIVTNATTLAATAAGLVNIQDTSPVNLNASSGSTFTLTDTAPGSVGTPSITVAEQ